MMKTFGGLTGHFNPPARGGTASSLIVIMHGWGQTLMILLIWPTPCRFDFPVQPSLFPTRPIRVR